MALKRTLLNTSDAAAGVLSLQNPEGQDLIITRCILNITTIATAACTLDAGVGSSATTKYDNLIDGKDVNAAIGAFDNIEDKGTNGKTRQVWKSGEYLTISTATGAVAGLAGSVLVEYERTTQPQ